MKLVADPHGRTIVSKHEDFGTAWMILFAKQDAVKVITLECRRLPRRLHVDDDAAAFGDRHLKRFEIFPLQHRAANDIVLADGEELWILPTSYFDGRLVCSGSEALPFDEWGAGLSEPPRKKRRDAGPRRERAPREPEGFRQALRSECAWLTDLEVDRMLSARGAGPSRPRASRAHPLPDDAASDSSHSDVGGEGDADEAEPVLAVYEPRDLLALRDAEAVEEHQAMEFYVRVLGGRWTFQHTGAAADGCSYFARAGQASLWCRTYAFPRQRGYHYLKYGGREGPHALCNEIARRAQHFFVLWRDSGVPDFRYSGADYDAYVPGDEFLALRLGLAPGGVLARAAESVSALLPVNPSE